MGGLLLFQPHYFMIYMAFLVVELDSIWFMVKHWDLQPTKMKWKTIIIQNKIHSSGWLEGIFDFR